MVTEQDLWAVTLWVEEHEGDHGPAYIADQAARFVRSADPFGVAVWMKIARRYDALQRRGTPS